MQQNLGYLLGMSSGSPSATAVVPIECLFSKAILTNGQFHNVCVADHYWLDSIIITVILRFNLLAPLFPCFSDNVLNFLSYASHSNL